VPSKFNLSLVFIPLAAVAAAGAIVWFGLAGHGPAGSTAQNLLLAFDQTGFGRDVSGGGAAAPAQTDAQDLAMFDFSFEKLEAVYYKPIDVASLVRGEEHGITAYLKSKQIAAQLPVAASDASLDEGAGDGVLRSAFSKYGAKVGDEDLTYAAISGMLDSLGDPYTVFLDPRDNQSLTELISGGDFGGIGVYIGQETKTLETVIIEPIDGTPAQHAGLKAGDVIVSVDGHATKGMKLDPVMNLIRGKAGTTVHLVVKRTDQTALLTVDVVREQIHVPSVAYRMIGPANDIGYVQLFDFGDTSADEVNTALTALTKQGAKAFVLDLRNNGGGLLRAAVDISSKFISDGPIVSIIDRDGKIETDDANGDAIAPHPLVVLVNQYTASASEITAGAIQDTKVGTLIGVKTFGKGVVQTIFDLPGASAIKITTARYVTPAGRDINKKGIEPDVVVDMDPRLVGVTDKDVQLRAALSDIEKQLALASH
jgi:carboxyl-terminal processing protease